MAAMQTKIIGLEIPKNPQLWKEEVSIYLQGTNQGPMTDEEIQVLSRKCMNCVEILNQQGIAMEATPEFTEPSSDPSALERRVIHVALQIHDEMEGKKCAWSSCNKRTDLLKCQGCYQKYCSKEHQRSDWRYIHKLICAKLHLKKDNNV